MADGREQCDACRRWFHSLPKHWSKSPACRPVLSQPAPQQQEDANLSRIYDASVLHERAAQMLQHLVYDKMASESFVNELKPAMAATRALELDVLWRRIRSLLRPGTEAELDAELESIADPVYGLSKAERERAYAMDVQKLPVIEPRVRSLRSPGSKIDYKDVKNHGTVGFSFVDSLARLMQEDADICRQIVAASDKWKTGDLHGVRAESLADVDDTAAFRAHEITRKRRPSRRRTWCAWA